MQNHDRPALALGMGAYIMWGLFPLYFHQLHRVPPFEIVGHRIVWSMVLLLLVMTLTGRWRHLAVAVRDGFTLARLTLSALLIAVNWLIYIWAVNSGHILAASLGYFLGPLVNVALGMLFLGERLSVGQKMAVGMAAFGVAEAAFGQLSEIWISVTLAVSFSLYGLIRKTTHVPALEGLLIETLVLAPFCIAAMIGAMALGYRLHFGRYHLDDALLIGSGAVTSLPLIMFATAARRLNFTTIGLLQYIAPTLVFVIGAFVYGEPLRAGMMIAFAIIWMALLFYVVDSRRRESNKPVYDPAEITADQEIR